MFDPLNALKFEFKDGGDLLAVHRAAKGKLRFEGAFLEGLERKIGKLSKEVLSKPMGTYQWTPAHVAVIAGNVSALKLIKERGGDLNAADQHGFTPMEYALGLDRSDCALLMKKAEVLAHRVPQERREVLSRCLPKKVPFRFMQKPAKAADDFHKPLDRVLIACRTRFTMNNILEVKAAKRTIFHPAHTLKLMADQLGFSGIWTEKQYTPRDPMIHTQNGEEMAIAISTKNDKDDFSDLAGRVSVGTVMLGQSPPPTLHPIFSCLVGMSARLVAHAEVDLEAQMGYRQFMAMPFYIEGGNFFQVMSAQGEKICLISRVGMDMIHMLARVQEDGALKDPRYQQGVQIMLQHVRASDEEISHMLKKLFYLGHIQEGGKTGRVTPEQLTDILNDTIQNPLGPEERIDERAESLGMIKTFKGKEQERMEESARKYFAERFVLKTRLNALFQSKHFIELASIIGHLDSWIMPGPNHTLFYADPGTALKLLESLTRSPVELGLTQKDQELLETYLTKTKEVSDKVHDFLTIFHADISESTLQPIPIPGIFYHPDRVINFMNALTGRPRPGEQIVATLGVQEGDQLGSVLMDAFAMIMEEYSGAKVFFIGEDLSNPGSFPESFSWMEEGTGVHCMTKELPTKDFPEVIKKR